MESKDDEKKPKNEASAELAGKTETKNLHDDLLGMVEGYLSEEDLANPGQKGLRFFKKEEREFFQEKLNQAQALKASITGNPELLIKLVQKSPHLLFVQHEKVTDPAGQVFYNVSPYQMMLFLCDDDMLKKVMAEVTLSEELSEIMESEKAKLRQGGADLVKLDRDPMSPGFNFDDILHFRTTLYGNAVTFPLLENPEGVLYYKDRNNEVHWYRANKATRSIEPMELSELTKQQAPYTQLLAKMNAMEPMSARRSSNDEHQFITNAMPVQIVRHGIHYEQDGIQYRDTHHDFNRYTNAYRKYIRLYDQAQTQEQRNEAYRVWKTEVGHVQREVMWLLQRYCEENRPFYPSLSDNYKSEEFCRGFKFENWSPGVNGRIEDIYSIEAGALHGGFGTDFGLYKGLRGAGCRGGRPGSDLIAVTRLVEDARTNVAELLNMDLDRPGTSPK